MSLRGMVDDDLFETKDRQLREWVERIKEVSRDAQGENDRKSALYSKWWDSIDQVLTAYREGLQGELRNCEHDIMSV